MTILIRRAAGLVDQWEVGEQGVEQQWARVLGWSKPSQAKTCPKLRLDVEKGGKWEATMPDGPLISDRVAFEESKGPMELETSKCCDEGKATTAKGSDGQRK